MLVVVVLVRLQRERLLPYKYLHRAEPSPRRRKCARLQAVPLSMCMSKVEETAICTLPKHVSRGLCSVYVL